MALDVRFSFFIFAVAALRAFSLRGLRGCFFTAFRLAVCSLAGRRFCCFRLRYARCRLTPVIAARCRRAVTPDAAFRAPIIVFLATAAAATPGCWLLSFLRLLRYLPFTAWRQIRLLVSFLLLSSLRHFRRL